MTVSGSASMSGGGCLTHGQMAQEEETISLELLRKSDISCKEDRNEKDRHCVGGPGSCPGAAIY